MIDRESPSILRAAADYLDRHREAELAGVEYIRHARHDTADQVLTEPLPSTPSLPGSLPVVELDTEAQAAYVRFRDGQVARTKRVETDANAGLRETVVVTIDLDADDNILGLELIGVKDFTVQSLLQKAHLEHAVPSKILERTKYLAAA